MNSSPLDKFYYWEKTTPQGILFRQPIRGQWHEYTFEHAGREIRNAVEKIFLPNYLACYEAGEVVVWE